MGKGQRASFGIFISFVEKVIFAITLFLETPTLSREETTAIKKESVSFELVHPKSSPCVFQQIG